jgi:hypothetical protein
VLAGLLAAAGTWAAAIAAGNLRSEFNRPGNILIADQFNNRVIEVTPNGDIVWQFGIGPDDFSPQSILGCNSAHRAGPHTLMAGTGIPPGVDPAAPNGAADNRVILDHLSWGILSWLVRAQLGKGVKDKGKMHYQRCRSTYSNGGSTNGSRGNSADGRRTEPLQPTDGGRSLFSERPLS